MSDKQKIKLMADANWTPSVTYWKDKYDALLTKATEPAQVTVQEAATVLADMAERRALPFYVMDMLLTKDGDGPATIGVDAASIQYEVWDAVTLNTISTHQFLSNAIQAALRAIAGDRT